MRARSANAASRSLVVVLTAVAVLVAACGPGSVPTQVPSSSASAPALSFLPVIITSPVVVGENRLLFSYLDQENLPAAAPDRTATLALIPEGATEPVATATGRFVWGIQDVAGVYVTNMTLPSSGRYIARFTTEAPGSAAETADMSIDVLADAPGVRIGDPAPPSDTLTLADVEGQVDRISTDAAPVKRFYEQSIADAVAAKKPFVLAFATPAFCQTKQCGPTLDRVKAVAAAYPDLAVINVEPYELQYTDGRLQPVLEGDPPHLKPVAAVEEWGLQTEPWIFVVDGSGVVRGSFEAIVAEDELKASIDQVIAGS